MVLNGLGFSSRALYLMTDFLRNKPVDLLINPNLTAEDFNDDTLGRALDDLYEHGVTEVFAGVSARAMRFKRTMTASQIKKGNQPMRRPCAGLSKSLKELMSSQYCREIRSFCVRYLTCAQFIQRSFDCWDHPFKNVIWRALKGAECGFLLCGVSFAFFHSFSLHLIFSVFVSNFGVHYIQTGANLSGAQS
jgi:hypothetical protein